MDGPHRKRSFFGRGLTRLYHKEIPCVVDWDTTSVTYQEWNLGSIWHFAFSLTCIMLMAEMAHQLMVAIGSAVDVGLHIWRCYRWIKDLRLRWVRCYVKVIYPKDAIPTVSVPNTFKAKTEHSGGHFFFHFSLDSLIPSFIPSFILVPLIPFLPPKIPLRHSLRHLRKIFYLAGM